MGKPVWMALSEPGCWRWMTKRADSPWYPSMRIFRQTTRGSWDGVFERIAEELTKRVPAPAPKLSESRPCLGVPPGLGAATAIRPLELIPPRRPQPGRVPVRRDRRRIAAN